MLVWALASLVSAAPLCADGNCEPHWELCASLEKGQWHVAIECYLSAVNSSEVPCHLAGTQRTPWGCLLGYLQQQPFRPELDALAAVWKKLDLSPSDVVVALGDEDRAAAAALQARIGFGATALAPGLEGATQRLLEDLTPLVRGPDREVEARLTPLSAQPDLGRATVVYVAEASASSLAALDLAPGTVVVVEGAATSRSNDAPWARGCFPGLKRIGDLKTGALAWTLFLQVPTYALVGDSPLAPLSASWGADTLDERVDQLVASFKTLEVNEVFADIADPQRFERLAAAAGEPEPPLLERTFSPSAFREFVRAGVIGDAASPAQCALRQLTESDGLDAVMLDDALAELKIQPADAVVVAHSVRAAAAAAMRGAGTVQVVPAELTYQLASWRAAGVQLPLTPANGVDPDATIVVLGPAAASERASLSKILGRKAPRAVEVCDELRGCQMRQHRWVLTSEMLPTSAPGLTFVKHLGYGAHSMYLYGSTDPNDEDATIVF